MRLIAIPTGTFVRGSDPPEGNPDEWPRRTDSTAAYEIGETQVTVGQFTPFVDAGGYRERRFWSQEGWAFREASALEAPRFWGEEEWAPFLAPSHPVVGVSWFEAEAFACFSQLRLPTEAEWERGARGEDGRRFPWGDEWDASRAHHRGHERHTLPVRSRNESPHGLWDCAGNVWEWCDDIYAPGLRGARGGAWNAHPPQLRCAARNAWPPTARFSNIGFRLAR